MFQDALVKQGMYTQYAENLLKSVTDMVNSSRYDITLAKNCIIALMPHIQTEGNHLIVVIQRMLMFQLSQNIIMIAHSIFLWYNWCSILI